MLAALLMTTATAIVVTGQEPLPDFSSARVIRLGTPLNSGNLDYGPWITADGLMLYFVSNRKGGEGGHDIWMAAKADRRDSIFLQPVNPGKLLNTLLNEGACTITADGMTMYYAACNRPEGAGDCDIYEARYIEGAWTIIRNVKELNTPDWDSQPAVSADGQSLYFVSTRPGTIGGPADADIYLSTLESGGFWSKPRHLDRPVNSAEREDSPFLSADGRRLFFASTRRGGNGGLDFYVSQLQANNSWGEPQNLGTPINSPTDDRFLAIPFVEDVMYYSSGREKGDAMDLQMVLLPRAGSNNVLVYGRVFDAATGRHITGQLEVYDSLTGERLFHGITDRLTGAYTLMVNASKPRTLLATMSIGYDVPPMKSTLAIPSVTDFSQLRIDLPLRDWRGADTTEGFDLNSEIEGRAIRVYPGLATDSITIDVSQAYRFSGTKSLVVTDAYDEVVVDTSFDTDLATLIVSNFAPGAYVVRVEDATSIFIKR
jgi:dipeptidyl aminopeptidase/acylaminoacyl peptidase